MNKNVIASLGVVALIILFGYSQYTSVPALNNPVAIEDSGFRLDGGTRHVVLKDASGQQLKVALIAQSGKSLSHFPLSVTHSVFGYPVVYQPEISGDYEKELIKVFNELNVDSHDEDLNSVYIRLNGKYKHEKDTGVIYSIYSILRARN